MKYHVCNYDPPVDVEVTVDEPYDCSEKNIKKWKTVLSKMYGLKKSCILTSSEYDTEISRIISEIEDEIGKKTS